MFNAEKLLRSRPLNHISWLLMACYPLVHLTGCATKDNNYTQFYQDRAGAGTSHFPPYSGSTKILTTSNAVTDAKDLYRKGYTLLGVSEFQGPVLSDGALRFQAKQVGADVVLRSRAYLRTATPATGLPSSLYLHESHIGLVRRVTYRLYEYDTGFFRRGLPAILGILYGPTPSEIRQKLERSTGAFVFVVRNGSPAFNANILEGDVILKMDGEDVMSEAGLREKLNQLAGQKVELEIWRNGQFKTVSVQLNNRP
jgi:hypothetical protein